MIANPLFFMKVSSPVVSITALGETAGTQSRAGRRLLSTNIAIKTIFIKFAKTIFIIIGKKNATDGQNWRNQ